MFTSVIRCWEPAVWCTSRSTTSSAWWRSASRCSLAGTTSMRSCRGCFGESPCCFDIRTICYDPIVWAGVSFHVSVILSPDSKPRSFGILGQYRINTMTILCMPDVERVCEKVFTSGYDFFVFECLKRPIMATSKASIWARMLHISNNSVSAAEEESLSVWCHHTGGQVHIASKL